MNYSRHVALEYIKKYTNQRESFAMLVKISLPNHQWQHNIPFYGYSIFVEALFSCWTFRWFVFLFSSLLKFCDDVPLWWITLNGLADQSVYIISRLLFAILLDWFSKVLSQLTFQLAGRKNAQFSSIWNTHTHTHL